MYQFLPYIVLQSSAIQLNKLSIISYTQVKPDSLIDEHTSTRYRFHKIGKEKQFKKKMPKVKQKQL